jgi:hypothetical protein
MYIKHITKSLKTFKAINFTIIIKMSAQIDCPICMDSIEFNKNCVTTECGHCFHASCLMTSVAHNGFGCPYCRTAMAEEVQEDDSTEYESVDGDDEPEMFDDDALRGFRFFFNNLNGEEHDEDDVEEEVANEELEQENETEEQDSNVPSTDFVAQKLREQGITFEKLVHMICNLDHEEYAEDEAADRFSDELFGKIRIIVSNYQPEQVASPVVIQEQHHVSSSVVPPEAAVVIPAVPQIIDFSAQPKTPVRIMMHV